MCTVTAMAVVLPVRAVQVGDDKKQFDPCGTELIVCTGPTNLPFPGNCTQYLTCREDRLYLQDCPDGLFFDNETLKCRNESYHCQLACPAGVYRTQMFTYPNSPTSTAKSDTLESTHAELQPTTIVRRSNDTHTSQATITWSVNQRGWSVTSPPLASSRMTPARRNAKTGTKPAYCTVPFNCTVFSENAGTFVPGDENSLENIFSSVYLLTYKKVTFSNGVSFMQTNISVSSVNCDKMKQASNIHCVP